MVTSMLVTDVGDKMCCLTKKVINIMILLPTS